MTKQVRLNQIQFITDEMAEMPIPEKTILQLKYWHNYSLEEIAFICDLSLSLTRTILNEAIHRLRLSYLIEFSAPKGAKASN